MSAHVCSGAPWGGYKFSARSILKHRLMSEVGGGTHNRDVVDRVEIAAASRGRRSAFVDALHGGFKENF